MKANERLKLEIDERKKTEEKLGELVKELQDALKKVKTLSGLLPICASCKKIRDDRGYWTQVEVYVRDHTKPILPTASARNAHKNSTPIFIDCRL